MEFPIILFLGLGGIWLLISIALLIFDERAKAKITDDGRYELKVGYSAYLGFVLQTFGFLIMIVSAMDAFYHKQEMLILFVPLIVVLFWGMIYLILEIRNHKVFFEETKISKTNPYKFQKEIAFQDLSSVKYSLFGYGRNLVFKDVKDNKIKVNWTLRGFSSLVEFLKKRALL